MDLRVNYVKPFSSFILSILFILSKLSIFLSMSGLMRMGLDPAVEIIMRLLVKPPDGAMPLFVEPDRKRIEIGHAGFDHRQHKSGVGRIEKLLAGHDHVYRRRMRAEIDWPAVLRTQTAAATRGDPG